jgi:uncharacterized membrane protein
MTQELVFDSKLESEKNLAWWLYIFHGASFLLSLGAFSWIPLIINFIKRPDTVGTFVHSHHTWQIHSFLWYLFWMILGGVFFFTFIGIPLAWLIWTLAWLWKAYRLLKGLIDLHANKPMPV